MKLDRLAQMERMGIVMDGRRITWRERKQVCRDE